MDSNWTLRQHYEDWVPKEDRRRFFRIEQSLGSLEDDPGCKEASSTLFWQLFFFMHKMSDEAKGSNIRDGGLSGTVFESSFCDRICNIVWALVEKSPEVLGTDAYGRSAVAFVELHLTTILLRAFRKGLWQGSDSIDKLLAIGEDAF